MTDIRDRLFADLKHRLKGIKMFDEIINCGNCLCFRANDKQAGGEVQGACHKAPPTVVVLPTRVATPGRPADMTAASAFPPVSAGQGCFGFIANQATARLVADRQAVAKQETVQ